MTRETRLNLTFLTIFLAISIPGAVILFKKKLDPQASSMSMPESVRKRLPFMSPLPVPEDKITRYVPEVTGQWLDDLVRRQTGQGTMFTWKLRPVISADRMAHLADLRITATQTILYIILWDPDAGAARQDVTLQASQGGTLTSGQVDLTQAIDIPDLVRKELVLNGFAQPPGRVVWVRATVDRALLDTAAAELKVGYTAGGGRRESVIKLFP